MRSHGKGDTKQRQSNRLHANPAPPPAAAQTRPQVQGDRCSGKSNELSTFLRCELLRLTC